MRQGAINNSYTQFSTNFTLFRQEIIDSNLGQCKLQRVGCGVNVSKLSLSHTGSSDQFIAAQVLVSPHFSDLGKNVALQSA